MTSPDPSKSAAAGKPIYERPTIIRHQMGMMNKFARAQAIEPLTQIDGVSVDALVEAYGSPLFVFSEREIVLRYRELHDFLALRYPKVRLAWSYKTNYLDAVCRVFQREGAHAEVVSEMEYDKALRLGFRADEIHFNGPDKSAAVLERALPAGTMIHIDHFDELALVESIARRLGIRPRVAIRINLAVAGAPPWSRFGFNLESGQARDAVRRILAGGVLELGGLHAHIGTFITDPAAYRELARKLAGFANELRSDHGIILDFIDLGGGFASHNTLKATYLPGEQSTPSLARYAEAIAEGIAELRYQPGEMPTLVLETGRALIDDAGYLVATTLANKRLPDGRRAVVLDVGVNVLFTAFWYNHDVIPAQPFHGMPEPTVLYGPLCMNIDVVRDALVFPPLEVGDRLVFKNVGAYNVTQWMQFITYRPAVAMIGRDGRHARIRRREDLDALLRYEELPEWL
ncbi:MAG: diaminopimelate decarboxylase [Myxococcales bacterium]|nr:diaminopimelate decarboxylase [Myxococcales bacterium]MCB9701976.1 diaminopimelate decarboxylase [Myxococcales bacterium]